MKIYKTLNKFQIDGLRIFCKYVCQQCERSERIVGTLEPHKINPERGYRLDNIKMVCDYEGKIGGKFSCHRIFSSAQRMASGTQGM